MLEIQFGEGGNDSKRFVHELYAAYVKYADSLGLGVETLSSTDGQILARVSGPGCWSAFRYEPGKHCVQRAPDSNKSGRRHTSMVAVAVLPLPTAHSDEDLNPRDLEVKTQGGSGPGGQHQNKTDSAVRMKHLPTGLSVMINGRDQHRNRRSALRILTAKVNEQRERQAADQHGTERRRQLGDGGRGDKVRTYNFIDSRVVDHRLGKRTGQIKQVMKGRFDLLLE